MMQETENMAGGMSYRTMNGIEIDYIIGYLEGSDENSSNEILGKNREYYIASADKTISRLELAKKRVEYGHLDKNYEEMIYIKISSSIKWLEELKEYINNVSNTSELLKSDQYKRWHAVKLIPSAAEGIVITTSIKRKINDIDKNLTSNDQNSLMSAILHNKKAESIFESLLNLTNGSDFKAAERMRIEGYRESVLAEKKINNLD
jgi:hypothetical protein